MTVTAARCDVCEAPLSGRCRQVTGLCYQCLQAGAHFAHGWMADLAASGEKPKGIGAIVGCSPATVRTRLSEMRRGMP